MRISQTQEWALVAALIAYLAFTDGFWTVRSFLASSIGKVIGLAVIAYVWTCVSPLVALLLALGYVRCAGLREGVDSTLTPTATTCPEGSTPMTDQPGKCKKADGSIVSSAPLVPPSTPPASTPPPPPMAAPPSMTLPPMPPPPPAAPPATTESFSPYLKEDDAGGCSFSPV